MLFSWPKVIRGCLRFFFGIGVIWGLYFLRDNLWLRAYPFVISVVVWLAFIVSLTKKRTPLVEVSVRAMKKELTAAEVRYCYHLTIAWTIFMTLHVGVTATTLFLSHTFWALYNGCLSYVLMGGMFLVGFIIGKWRNIG